MINSNSLARYYDKLTPLERIPLILAADARGDAAETRRLEDSAPITRLSFRDHHWTGVKLQVLALQYLTEQLDLLAEHWHALWRLETEADKKDWRGLRDACAYRFVCNADAWRRFCEGLAIDPGVLTSGNYFGWLLDFYLERMPTMAPSREDLTVQLRDAGCLDGEPVTSDCLLKKWQDLWGELTT
jgi:hypothetical protein